MYPLKNQNVYPLTFMISPFLARIEYLIGHINMTYPVSFSQAPRATLPTVCWIFNLKQIIDVHSIIYTQTCSSCLSPGDRIHTHCLCVMRLISIG